MLVAYSIGGTGKSGMLDTGVDNGGNFSGKNMLFFRVSSENMVETPGISVLRYCSNIESISSKRYLLSF